MTSYASVAELKSYVNELTGGVQTSFTANEDALLQVFLDEATDEIVSMTGRWFISALMTRAYERDAVTGQTLYLDADFLSFAGDADDIVNGDGANIPTSGVTLLPQSNICKSSIRLKAGYSWQFSTDGVIRITGNWGFSASPPAAIKRLTKRLAYFYWIKRTATGEATVLNETTTTGAAEYPADIMSVLRRYRRGVIR